MVERFYLQVNEMEGSLPSELGLMTSLGKCTYQQITTLGYVNDVFSTMIPVQKTLR
jgi:hypothetical protein